MKTSSYPRPAKSSIVPALAAALLLTAGGCESRPQPGPTTGEPAPATASASSTADAQRHARVLAELESSQKRIEDRKARQQKLVELFAHFPADHAPQREELIIDAVRRRLHDPIEWASVETSFRGHEAVLEVSTDALKLNHVRFDVTALGAQRIADMLGHSLVTPRILQAIWENADVRLDPCTMPSDEKMATSARMLAHSRCVDDKIAGRTGLVSNVGKHWVLTNKLAGHPNLAANYGWFKPTTRPIQRVGTAHDTAHTDYSQVLRLVKRTVLVDGHPIDIHHVARSPELWGLVSDEGPLHVTRTARHGEEHLVPENLPPPDALSRAAALDAGFGLDDAGLPVDAKRLPDTTLAVRRHRLTAEVADQARVPRSELPTAALTSRGSGLCGHADPFFDLLSGLEVELSQLETQLSDLKAGLACGSALVDWLREASAYEVHLLDEHKPYEVALLPMTAPVQSKIEGRIGYAPLDLAPVGTKRAWCFDVKGDTKPHCPEGDQARVLLDVPGGTIGVPAEAWPGLVPALNDTAPPGDKLARMVDTFHELHEHEHDSLTVADGPHCPVIFDHSLAPRALVETGEQTFAVFLAKVTDHCARSRSGGLLGGHWHDVYVAKDEASAIELEARLGQRVHQLAVESHRQVASTKAEGQFLKTLETVRRRLPKVVRIQRTGTRIDVELRVELSEAEKAGVAGHVAERKEQVEAAATVVAMLGEGKLPSPEQLESARRASPVDSGSRRARAD